MSEDGLKRGRTRTRSISSRRKSGPSSPSNDGVERCRLLAAGLWRGRPRARPVCGKASSSTKERSASSEVDHERGRCRAGSPRLVSDRSQAAVKNLGGRAIQRSRGLRASSIGNARRIERRRLLAHQPTEEVRLERGCASSEVLPRERPVAGRCPPRESAANQAGWIKPRRTENRAIWGSRGSRASRRGWASRRSRCHRAQRRPGGSVRRTGRGRRRRHGFVGES